MRRSLKMVLGASLVPALLIGGMVLAQGGEAGAKDAYTGWASYGGTQDSSQYSSLDQIGAKNVHSLTKVWEFQIDGLTQTSPLVANGKAYVMANRMVVALDAATGKQLWSASTGRSMMRGITYWESADRKDRRILLSKYNHLVALNADSGEQIMSFGTNGSVDLREAYGRPVESIGRVQSATPGRIFDNLLILGSSPGEGYDDPPGKIRAYDVVSGALVWNFNTIPQPGEYGYDSWPADAWKKAGGANVWGEMTLDTKRGILFAPVSAPSYDFYGVNRHGNNLFGTSLLALDARTGKRLWHYQTVHHDLWDYDNAQAPKLLTVKRDGKPVDIVAMAGKTGFIYTFERESGKPFFPIEERPVPASDVPGEMASPTQPFPLLPEPFVKQTFDERDFSPANTPEENAMLVELLKTVRNEGIFTPPSFRGSIQMPGNHGGGQFGNAAVDPKRGTLYIVGINQPSVIKLVKPAAPASPAGGETGASLYAANCSACHGAAGEGQTPFPALKGIEKSMDLAAFTDVVQAGRNQMPAFATLNAAQVGMIYSWLGSLNPAPPGPKLIQFEEPNGAQEADPHAIHDASAGDRYYSGYNFLMTSRLLPANAPPWSILSAYDMAKGTLLWRVPFGSMPNAEAAGIQNGGLLLPKATLVATGSGLLLSATGDKKLRAWEAATGKVIWETDLPAGSGALPAIYSVGKRQFILVAASGTYADVVSGGKAPAGAGYIAYALPEATKGK